MNKERIEITPENIVKYLNEKLKTKIKSSEIKIRKAGSKKNETVSIWIKVEQNSFKELIKHLVDFDYPHLAVTSGNDLGKIIELIYHFTIGYGVRMREININISVELPKSNPKIDSICDLIPGALITEREKAEMLGVKIVGIPDDRRCFVPDDFPEGVYPWRRDETGPEKYYKNLHEVKK